MEGYPGPEPSEFDSYFRGGPLPTGQHGSALCRGGVRGRESFPDSSRAGADVGRGASYASAGSAGCAVCPRQGPRAWTHPTFKYFGHWGPGEAVERRYERAGREASSHTGGKRVRSARSSDRCGFHRRRRLAVGDYFGRGADAVLAGLGSCEDEPAGNTGDGPRAVPPNRRALPASGSREAMHDCGDQRSAGIGESGTGAAASSEVGDRESAEGICEMALLAGVGGAGCGGVLFDCETETIEPTGGSAIDASAAEYGGRKLTAPHCPNEP